MVDLNGHEAGNGGYSQGTPTAHRPLSYSEVDLANGTAGVRAETLEIEILKNVVGERAVVQFIPRRGRC
jgi:hypothetical protein